MSKSVFPPEVVESGWHACAYVTSPAQTVSESAFIAETTVTLEDAPLISEMDALLPDIYMKSLASLL